MILYCDTSALLKLYVAEADSGLVRQKMDQAGALARHCRLLRPYQPRISGQVAA